VVTKTRAEAAAVLSHVKQRVVRVSYSSPPRHGAAVAAEVPTRHVAPAPWDLNPKRDAVLNLRPKPYALNPKR
jgi:aspartate/tyrosine/aromatic aminotransferase